MMENPPKPKEVAHDEAPSVIIDHAFEPRAEWWTLCRHCHLAESAHKETTLPPYRYHSDDMPDED
ncbi:MAG TPA: hypothetical protein VM715_06560 [Candidatus Acidoferrum sp.]|nr:hypothetical protein [Candidatus Acidoferrum sp.]